MKDIEYVVKNATKTWNNVYHLHKVSDFSIEVNDDDDEEKDDKRIDSFCYSWLWRIKGARSYQER